MGERTDVHTVSILGFFFTWKMMRVVHDIGCSCALPSGKKDTYAAVFQL